MDNVHTTCTTNFRTFSIVIGSRVVGRDVAAHIDLSAYFVIRRIAEQSVRLSGAADG
jgi:hypothetical protein